MRYGAKRCAERPTHCSPQGTSKENKWTLEIKRQILGHNGIAIAEEEQGVLRPVHLLCPRCSLPNACTGEQGMLKVRLPAELSQEALDEIRAKEKEEMKKALVELLEEHPELMIEKFGRMYGHGIAAEQQLLLAGAIRRQPTVRYLLPPLLTRPKPP